MSDATGDHANAATINELHKLLDSLIGEMAHRGTYGSVELHFTVVDGIIQETSIGGAATKQYRVARRKNKASHK